MQAEKSAAWTRLLSLASRAAWLVPVGAAACTHWPIVSGYFKDDDFLHLYNITNGGLVEFLFTPHGGHMLMVRNLVFYTFHALFGLQAQFYLWSSFLTHLLNTWLLLRILHRQTQDR